MPKDPVVIITVKDGVAETFHSDTSNLLIVDHDCIGYADDLDTPAAYIEEILPLPIDSAYRVRAIEDIFCRMGNLSAYCLPAFNMAGVNLDLPVLEEMGDLRNWPGWLTIEQKRVENGKLTRQKEAA